MRVVAAVFALACGAVAQKPPATPGASFDQLSREARQAYESNRRDEAAALYTRALRLRPDWTEGWWAIGSIHYEAGRSRECRDALQRMVKLEPSAPAGWIVLGLCEFDLKQYDASFESLRRGHQLVPEGMVTPLLDQADYRIALILIRRGAFELSQEFLVKVAWHMKEDTSKMVAGGLAALRIAVFPEDVPEANREVVFLAGRAFWELATKPPADAEAAFSTLLEKYPSFPNVHYFYGTYLAAHRPPESIKQFQEELRVNPTSVPSRVQLALKYLDEPRLDEALKLAREAVQLSPDSVGCQLALGRVLTARGDDEGALAAFLVAKKLDPQSPQIRLFLTGAYRALGRTEEMRYEQAEHERLKKLVARWP